MEIDKLSKNLAKMLEDVGEIELENVDLVAENLELHFLPQLVSTVAQKMIAPELAAGKTLKDFEWETAFEGQSNSANVQEILTTLTNTLKFIVSLGGRPMTPEEKLLFNAILTQSNSIISPMELSAVSQESRPMPAIPTQVGGGSGAGMPEAITK